MSGHARPVAASLRAARSYARTLDGLQPEGRATRRGAKESRVYQQASPAVVLIVTDDGLGSGVLISPDGLIVTNLHVVGREAEVGVVFKPRVEGAKAGDADVHRAKVLRRDEVTDLALIQVSEVPSHAKPLTIAPTATVEVGSDVHAIGHPTGEAWTYTRGIVSQVRRDYVWRKHKATVIQTQTPINPGNSGGPLLDDNLQVIGINSFKSEGEGLNFAVSAEDVNTFLAMKTDRVSTAADAEAEACEAKVVSQRRDAKKKQTIALMDDTCDGKPDYTFVSPDDKAEPEFLYFDEDGDGVVDTMLLDVDRDGKIDESMHDTDNDGLPDMQGFYRNGENEPYRYERMKGSKKR